MTKIALITDTHFGIRADSLVFLSYQEKFLKEIFFPFLKENDIKHVIHLGDLFDRRKYINYATLNRVKSNFLFEMSNFDSHVIVGNHDVYLKNTNEINSLRELVAGKYNIKCYSEITEIEIDGYRLLLVPWINQENEERVIEVINKTQTQLCFGHFHLAGFEMERGSVSTHGMDRSILSKFDMVFSGHFHHKSSDGHIHYLGAPFQQTWADYDCMRGFHILDLKPRDLHFIQNPFDIFKRIEYNDTGIQSLKQLIENYARVNIEDCFVKVIVSEKNNPFLFSEFLDYLETLKPFDLKIIHDLKRREVAIDQTMECEDTLTIIYKTVDSMDLSIDKTKLNQELMQLYKQAINLEIT